MAHIGRWKILHLTTKELCYMMNLQQFTDRMRILHDKLTLRLGIASNNNVLHLREPKLLSSISGGKKKQGVKSKWEINIL